MTTTINLLKEYGNINATDEQIIKLIREHICEVESSHNIGNDYNGITIAQIVTKQEHKDSDKLCIYNIVTEENGEQIQIVAGDRNLQIGDKVAYIQPGAKVPYTIYTEPEPIIIKKAKLRGVESNGMLGSEKELNIGTDHTHVMTLPQDAPLGTPFAEYYNLNDIMVDIENKGITNRGDLFGTIGIARELTAITGNTFTSPEWFTNTTNNLEPENNCLNIKITNDAEALCHRYTAIALDNIEIKESPLWLKSILIKCNIKPINNIVDITNYIALLFGQPLHAFDYDKIINNDQTSNNTANITIRTARDKESILTLDGKVHNLNDRTIVIADNTHPIAIAGIIGGKDTEIDNNTKRIIIESANFDKTSIRKSSMELGIETDSATKFKHALDPEMCLPALLNAIRFAKELANASIASNIIDLYENKPTQPQITLKINKINEHLGTNLSKETITKILENLEYKIATIDDNTITATPPTWRKDIEIKEDIHEDIARIYGFNNIEIKLPKREIKPPQINKIFDTKKEIREILSSNNANECLNYSFVSLDNFKKCNLNPDLAFRIKNAISPDLSLMRTSLLQSLLQKTKENLQRGFTQFALFELNICHLNNYIDENNLPKEEWLLSMVITNNKTDKNTGSPYYIAKKYLENTLSRLGYKNIRYTLLADATENLSNEHIKNKQDMLDPNTSAIISIGENSIGIIGEPKKNVKDNFKLPAYTSVIEISINKLIEIENTTNKYKETPIYPPFSIDLCFELDENTKYEDIYNELYYIVNRENLWGKVECIDIYQKENNNRKKITFRLSGSNYNKTLTEKDIQIITDKAKKKIEQKYNGKLV